MFVVVFGLFLLTVFLSIVGFQEHCYEFYEPLRQYFDTSNKFSHEALAIDALVIYDLYTRLGRFDRHCEVLNTYTFYACK